MTSLRKGMGAIFFAVIMTVSVVAPAAGAGLADGSAETVELSDEPGEIHSSVQNADGTTEIVVRLNELEGSAIQAQGPEALQQYAAASQEYLTTFADSHSAIEVVNQFWITNAVLLEVDTDAVDMERLAQIQGVEELHANFEVQVPDRPESTSSAAEGTSVGTSAVDTTYGLEQVNAPDVWREFDTRGEGAKVAVLDTGVDADHPDIDLFTRDANDPTYPGGWAEIGDDGNPVAGSEPFDSDRHGTHVSGTVSGGDASGEFIGVAPNVDLMHGLVLNGGRGSYATIVGGMEWAVEENADVISMSLGGSGYSEAYIEPIQNAQDAGTIVVAASGNDGEGTSGSPANVWDVTAVGATDSNEQVTSFSSGETINTASAWGSSAPSYWPDSYIVPDVSAPGQNVKSSVPGGSYDEFPGTSMATPHVSGVVALMVSAADGDLDPDTIQQTLIDTSFKPDNAPSEQDTRWGHGIVDALAAVEAVADSGPNTGLTGTVTSDGEPVAEATVEVAGSTTTTAQDGSFELSADPGTYTLTVSGFGIQETSQTVTVEDKDAYTDVGTITAEPSDDATVGLVGGSYLSSVESALDSQLGADYAYSTVSSASNADSYDVLVVQSLANVDTNAFLDATSGSDVGVIYLDQWGDDANGIPQLASASSAVTDTFEDDSYSGDVTGPIYYEATADHPILDGIGVGEQVQIHDGEYADVAWFETSEFDVIGTVNDANAAIGSGLAVDDESSTVLAATLGYSEYVTGSDFSNDADRILANAVDYLANGGDSPEPAPAEFSVSSVDAPTAGETGETVTVDATVQNVGEQAGDTTVTFSFGGSEVDSQTVSLDAGSTTTVSFSATLPSEEGTYGWTVETPDDSASGDLTVEEQTGLPPVVGDSPPQDLNGDGLYRDVNGDGLFTYYDVQALNDNLDTPEVQSYPAAYNFALDVNPTSVRFADVEALYYDLIY